MRLIQNQFSCGNAEWYLFNWKEEHKLLLNVMLYGNVLSPSLCPLQPVLAGLDAAACRPPVSSRRYTYSCIITTRWACSDLIQRQEKGWLQALWHYLIVCMKRRLRHRHLSGLVLLFGPLAPRSHSGPRRTIRRIGSPGSSSSLRGGSEPACTRPSSHRCPLRCISGKLRLKDFSQTAAETSADVSWVHCRPADTYQGTGDVFAPL